MDLSSTLPANKCKRISYPADYVWRVVLIAAGWKHARCTRLPPLASYGAAHLSATRTLWWRLLTTADATIERDAQNEETFGQQYIEREREILHCVLWLGT